MRGLWVAAWALLPALAWAQDYPLPPPPELSSASIHLDFEADRLAYESTSAVIHLQGHVLVRESTRTVKAEELWLDTRSRLGRFPGRLFIEDGVSAVAGSSGEVDFARRSAFLREAKAGHGDWRIHARLARLSAGRRLDYYGADFTSCDYPEPHYHFHASRIIVVPRRYLLARNAVFYLGRVPLFYSPFLYKSLKPRHFLRWRVQPGYDRRNGGFLKGTLTTDHSPYLYSKLYLDYYSSQGLGAGAELTRRKGEDSRGTLYGYRIREVHDGTERWIVLGNQYQAFLSSMAFQGRLQVQSDADFNNHYARASLFRVTPEIINSAAVVYRLRPLTLRLSYSRLDTASESRARFLKTRESSPRLDAQTAPLRIGRLPWLNTFTGFADNSFERGRPYLEKSAGLGWEGTRTLNLARGVSLTPRVGYRQAYFNRVELATSFPSSRTVLGAWVGRYLLEPTLRVATPLGDWDLSYLYERRQKENSLVDDAGAPDRGVETSLLSVRDAFRPTRRTLVRLSSGYDVRAFRDRFPGLSERVEPIVAEIIYSPRHDLNLTVRDDYQLREGNRSFLASAQWGWETGNYVGLGAGHSLAAAGKYFLNADFGWVSSSGTWKLGGALRSETQTSGGARRLSRFHLFEKELTLAKLWHDFYTRVLVRLRPGGVKEAQIRIDLRFGGLSPQEARRRDWEAEWFPERRAGREDRP